MIEVANDNHIKEFIYTDPEKDYWNKRVAEQDWTEEELFEIRAPQGCFLNYIKDADFEWCMPLLYKDIVLPDGTADYKTIEALSVLSSYSFLDKASYTTSIYNGIKVKNQYSMYGHTIVFDWFKYIKNNAAIHLLGKFINSVGEELHPRIKTSYTELQNDINNTKAAIVSALEELHTLNLLQIKRRGSDGLLIILNTIEILKISPNRDTFDDEPVKFKNKYYGLNLLTPLEEDEQDGLIDTEMVGGQNE